MWCFMGSFSIGIMPSNSYWNMVPQFLEVYPIGYKTMVRNGLYGRHASDVHTGVCSSWVIEYILIVYINHGNYPIWCIPYHITRWICYICMYIYICIYSMAYMDIYSWYLFTRLAASASRLLAFKGLWTDSVVLSTSSMVVARYSSLVGGLNPSEKYKSIGWWYSQNIEK